MEARQWLVQVRRIGVTLVVTSATAWACGGTQTTNNEVSYGGSAGTPQGGSGPGGMGPVGGAAGVGGVNSGGHSGAINFDSGAGGSGSDLDAACASNAIEAKQQQLDMFIMFDKSGSMNPAAAGIPLPGPDRWTPVTAALKTFVQAPEMDGVGVGIGYFGLNPNTAANIADPGSCNANDYANPAVPIELLPGVRQKIIDSVNGQMPGGGTPTTPALQGAMQYATQWQVAHQDRKTIVVLASDGEPQGCQGNDLNAAVQVAQAGLAANPSIQTYVIGVGNVQGLNQIAQAGGTNMAFIVQDAAANMQFLTAMRQIRGQALGCQFDIPQPDGKLPDFTKVNVFHTPKGGGQGVIFHVNGASDCRPDVGGWYYEYDAAGNPVAIKACPESCQELVDGGGRVDIAVGCTSIPPPA